MTKECPIDNQMIFSALCCGKFRELTERQMEKFGLEYSGFIWKNATPYLHVICEHNPGGLDFTAIGVDGEVCWKGSLDIADDFMKECPAGAKLASRKLD